MCKKLQTWITHNESDQNKSNKGDCSLQFQQELFSKQLPMLHKITTSEHLLEFGMKNNSISNSKLKFHSTAFPSILREIMIY